MLPQYEAVSYERLRPGEVQVLRQKCPIAYVPLGTLEWHSFQNPLGTDGLKAHAICCEAALRHGGVVLPPIFHGWMGYDNWGPKGWDHYTLGYTDQAVLEGLLVGTVRALVAAGWKLIVGVTGHDIPEQVAIFERALKAGTANWGRVYPDASGFAVMEGSLHSPDADLPYGMDHAGAWETSCMMYAYPNSVDLDELRRRGLCVADELTMSGPEGIGGHNPLKHASPELGRRIVERMGDQIGRRAVEQLQQRGAAGRP